MALTGERAWIVELEVLEPVDEPPDRLAVRPLDLEAIDLPLLHGALPRIVGVFVDLDFLAVRAVLVDSRKGVRGVLPAAEDRQVARRVRVRGARRERLAVAPHFALEVALVAQG